MEYMISNTITNSQELRLVAQQAIQAKKNYQKKVQTIKNRKDKIEQNQKMKLFGNGENEGKQKKIFQ